jgi:hypothetical protein
VESGGKRAAKFGSWHQANRTKWSPAGTHLGMWLKFTPTAMSTSGDQRDTQNKTGPICEINLAVTLLIGLCGGVFSAPLLFFLDFGLLFIVIRNLGILCW